MEKVIGFRALSSVQLQNVTLFLKTVPQESSPVSLRDSAESVGRWPRRLRQVGKNISSLACTCTRRRREERNNEHNVP